MSVSTLGVCQRDVKFVYARQDMYFALSEAFVHLYRARIYLFRAKYGLLLNEVPLPLQLSPTLYLNEKQQSVSYTN